MEERRWMYLGTDYASFVKLAFIWTANLKTHLAVSYVWLSSFKFYFGKNNGKIGGKFGVCFFYNEAISNKIIQPNEMK